jgi:hypothetical protein
LSSALRGQVRAIVKFASRAHTCCLVLRRALVWVVPGVLAHAVRVPPPVAAGPRRRGAMVSLTGKRPGRSRFPRLSMVAPVSTSCPSLSPWARRITVETRWSAGICLSSSEGRPPWANHVATAPWWVGRWSWAVQREVAEPGSKRWPGGEACPMQDPDRRGERPVVGLVVGGSSARNVRLLPRGVSRWWTTWKGRSESRVRQASSCPAA